MKYFIFLVTSIKKFWNIPSFFVLKIKQRSFKCIFVFIVTPFDVVKTRLQVQERSETSKNGRNSLIELRQYEKILSVKKNISYIYLNSLSLLDDKESCQLGWWLGARSSGGRSGNTKPERGNHAWDHHSSFLHWYFYMSI